MNLRQKAEYWNQLSAQNNSSCIKHCKERADYYTRLAEQTEGIDMKSLDAIETGKNIRHRIKEKCMTVEYITDELGITKNAIYKWVRGECLPSIDNMVILAQLLGCTVNDLIILRGENT